MISKIDIEEILFLKKEEVMTFFEAKGIFFQKSGISTWIEIPLI